ncbi:hypothetical protein BB558_002542, partial [Smittium angustum]
SLWLKGKSNHLVAMIIVNLFLDFELLKQNQNESKLNLFEACISAILQKIELTCSKNNNTNQTVLIYYENLELAKFILNSLDRVFKAVKISKESKIVLFYQTAVEKVIEITFAISNLILKDLAQSKFDEKNGIFASEIGFCVDIDFQLVQVFITLLLGLEKLQESSYLDLNTLVEIILNRAMVLWNFEDIKKNYKSKSASNLLTFKHNEPQLNSKMGRMELESNEYHFTPVPWLSVSNPSVLLFLALKFLDIFPHNTGLERSIINFLCGLNSEFCKKYPSPLWKNYEEHYLIENPNECIGSEKSEEEWFGSKSKRMIYSPSAIIKSTLVWMLLDIKSATAANSYNIVQALGSSSFFGFAAGSVKTCIGEYFKRSKKGNDCYSKRAKFLESGIGEMEISVMFGESNKKMKSIQFLFEYIDSNEIYEPSLLLFQLDYTKFDSKETKMESKEEIEDDRNDFNMENHQLYSMKRLVPWVDPLFIAKIFVKHYAKLQKISPLVQDLIKNYRY